MKKTITALILALCIFTLCTVTAFAEETTVPETTTEVITEVVTEETPDEVTTEADAETPTDSPEQSTAESTEEATAEVTDKADETIPEAELVITVPDEYSRSQMDEDGVTVTDAESDTELPKTGDTRVIAPAIVTLILASGALIYCIVSRKKKKAE